MTRLSRTLLRGTRRGRTRLRSLRTSVLLAVAAVVLSGCGTHPGAAVVVGDTAISLDQVDAAARALCSVNATPDQPERELATRGARLAALQFLIDNELSHQFAAEEDLAPDQEQVSATLAQNAETIDALPEAERADFRDLLVGFRESELILAAAGNRSLREQGQTASDPQQAAAEGARLRGEWSSSVEVEVNPRFGEYTDGALMASSGSISFPVSEQARAGAQADPGESWVASLPASQKCA